MSHAIYQTQALVLNTKNMREDNKLAILYTQDFGLIYVAAQSVRKEHSKMKAHLQTLSLVEIDIVQGRDIWRLTGIHELYSSLKLTHLPWFSLCEKIAATLQRLCQGEEPNTGLWQEVIYFYDNLESLPQEKISLIEIVIIARILNALGYWSGQEHCITSNDPYSAESLLYTREHKRQLISKINQGLQDSQL